MLSKMSFTLLVENGTIPFFAFVSIISLKDCRHASIHIQDRLPHPLLMSLVFKNDILEVELIYILYLICKKWRIVRILGGNLE